MLVLIVALLLLGLDKCTALDNGMANTPPMGWRSWNCFHGEVTDAQIRSVIVAMSTSNRLVDGKATSLLDLGYEHVGVDDGWQACFQGRAINGSQKSFHAMNGIPLVNVSKFPNLTDMVAYGHSKQIKMGW